MPEAQGEPSRFSYYPTPGLRLLGALPKGPVRAIKQCTTGGIYAVGGDTVYQVHADWTATSLGTISGGRPYPVSMQDNGLTMVVVDGTAGGWTIDLPSNAFAAITQNTFYGADKVDYLDTYLIFNKPGTPQFYWTDSLSTNFDPLWFTNKESFSDLLVTLAVAKREIWLLGDRTTEVWTNVGAADIPFQEVSGVFVDHGCAAKYSPATYDDTVYWLSGDRAGQGIVLAGAGYQTKKISTWAIEAELTKYPKISDAIGFTYSLAGHVCYVLTFPTADATWVYDTTTGQWHEWLWIDNDGVEHRHRANCAYACNGIVVAGDWENGNLYAVENSVYTDNGQPIKRQRSFPHLINGLDRVFYRQFVADIESGNPGAAADQNIGTFLDTTFTAADGTLLSAYRNADDVNATWTLVNGTEAAITNDELTGPTGGGHSAYKSIPAPGTDYSVQFRAVPTDYAHVGTASIFAIARATTPGTGYRATVAGDGTQYQLSLGVEGGGATTLPMGTIASGSYAITLAVRGALITVTAQRTTDFAYLQPGGTWSRIAGAPAISLDDGTYTAGGVVMIGGSW